MKVQIKLVLGLLFGILHEQYMKISETDANNTMEEAAKNAKIVSMVHVFIGPIQITFL